MATAIVNNLTNLLGVVLCGGKSVRMGTDKGLLMHTNNPWAVLIAQKFETLNIPFIVSINQAQTATYQTHFNPNVLVVDTQTIPGPLQGLLTVHLQYPQKNLLVLACDMVDMQNQTIQKLINNYTTEANFDFYAFHNGDFWEPFCGIYTAKGLNSLVLENQTNFSLQHILTMGLTQKNKILDMASFKNYNSF